MRIESLELFLSVAEHGSVSRTAKQHFISQQGVSSALKALEKELGTPLFTRGGPKLELTERGRAIASEAQRIVDSHRRPRTQRRKTSVPSRFLPRRSPRQHSKNCSSITKRQRPERDCASPNVTCSALSTISLRDTHRHVARRSKDARHSQSSAACRAWTKRLAA